MEGHGMGVEKRALVSQGQSKPIGRYSPGLALQLPPSARLVFISGQVATDDRGQVLGRRDAGRQAEVVFQRIRQILGLVGGDLADLVSVVIYVVNVERDFTAVSAIRNQMFGDPAPASTLVEVSRLAEEDCLVEISGIAVVNASPAGVP
jgi:2-iminobutanoate/2-iminopropanoate deaminase